MAKQLIESLSSDWEPGKYHDTYRERVLDLIERKAEGKEIAVQPVEEPQPVPDLMAALEASVKAARQDKDSGGRSADGAKAAGFSTTMSLPLAFCLISSSTRSR